MRTATYAPVPVMGYGQGAIDLKCIYVASIRTQRGWKLHTQMYSSSDRIMRADCKEVSAIWNSPVVPRSLAFFSSPESARNRGKRRIEMGRVDPYGGFRPDSGIYRLSYFGESGELRALRETRAYANRPALSELMRGATSIFFATNRLRYL